MNVLCMGGRTIGPAVAWDLVDTFLHAEFSQADRHLRRSAKSRLSKRDAMASLPEELDSPESQVEIEAGDIS